MAQLGCHWTDFHEIYLSIFRKSVENIQVSLKPDNNSGYFTLHYITLRRVYSYELSRRILGNRNVSDKSCWENQNTFYVQYIFFSENRVVYEIM